MAAVAPQRAPVELRTATIDLSTVEPGSAEAIGTAILPFLALVLIASMATGDEFRYGGTPEVMAGYAVRMSELGVDVIGACCGSTPAHMRTIGTLRRPGKSSEIACAVSRRPISVTSWVTSLG